MLYFAYGSNLDPRQMRERAPSHRTVGMAALADHRLVFPRYSPTWAGGTAGVQLAHGATVWGMLYDVDEADFVVLDRHEGFKGPGDQHNGYDREQVTVDLTRPDDQSVPRRVRAWTYLARPSNPSPPSREYLDTIVRGARHHRLPEEYVAAIAATPVAVEGESRTPES